MLALASVGPGPRNKAVRFDPGKRDAIEILSSNEKARDLVVERLFQPPTKPVDLERCQALMEALRQEDGQNAFLAVDYELKDFGSNVAFNQRRGNSSRVGRRSGYVGLLPRPISVADPPHNRIRLCPSTEEWKDFILLQ